MFGFPDFAVAVAVAFSAACAYFDIANRRNIPERLLQAFAAVSIAYFALFARQDAFASGVAQVALIAGGGWLLYKAGQLGLADVYVIASIALLFPLAIYKVDYGFATYNVPVPFVAMVLFFSGMLFVFIMSAYYGWKILSERLGQKNAIGANKATAFLAALAAAAAFAAYQLLFGDRIFTAISLAISYIAAAGVFFCLFMAEIKDSMTELVPVAKLELEDVVAIDKMDGETVKKYAIAPLLDERNIAAIKKSGQKKVPVYTKMPPFLPFVLAGLLLALVFWQTALGLLFGAAIA